MAKYLGIAKTVEGNHIVPIFQHQHRFYCEACVFRCGK